MKVLLLRPPLAFGQASATTLLCPPLGLAYIAAAVRAAGHDTSCIDASGEAPFRQTPDGHGLIRIGLTTDEILDRIAHAAPAVIGVSVFFSQDWPATRALLTDIKAAFPALIIVAGGEHVSALPELCLTQCPALDVCVRGEGEGTMTDLLDSIASSRDLASVSGIVYRTGDGLTRTALRPRLDLDRLTWPAWDLVPIEHYLANGFSFGVNRGRTLPILASRGCPFECTFCSNPDMWTQRWLVRPVEDVIAEMAHAIETYRVECFDFYDLTTIVRRDWILAFCDAIIARGWKISWQMPAGTRSEALDADVLAALFRSGNRYLVYAPESGSTATLAAVRKRIDLDVMAASIATAAAIGHSVKLNMIVGLPTETWRDALATLRFLVRMAWVGVEDTFVASFSPYPGSALFEQMRASGQLPALDDDYFRGLASIASFAQSRSYSAHLSNGAVTVIRMTGMLLFYSVGFLRKPSRITRLLRNVWHNREESRLELGLLDIKTRWLGRRA